MKRILFTLLLPVFCGAAGFCLRRQQLLTGFEPTGLAIPGNLPGMLLIALSLLVTAACLLLSSRCKYTPKSYNEAFSSPGNAFYLFFVALAALLLLGSAALGLRELWTQVQAGTTLNWLQLLLWCMCVVSAICVLSAAGSNFRYNGRRSNNSQRRYSLALLALPYTACLWLVTSYQQFSADPVILSYVYQMLAMIATLLAVYFIASFSFQRPRPRLCLLFSLLGIYLSIVTLADSHDWPARLLFLASVLYLSHTALMLMSNTLAPPPAPPQQSEAPQELSEQALLFDLLPDQELEEHNDSQP